MQTLYTHFFVRSRLPQALNSIAMDFTCALGGTTSVTLPRGLDFRSRWGSASAACVRMEHLFSADAVAKRLAGDMKIRTVASRQRGTQNVLFERFATDGSGMWFGGFHRLIECVAQEEVA